MTKEKAINVHDSAKDAGLISKQIVLDVLDHIAEEVADGDGYCYGKWREYVEQMQTAQPTGDLISRQAAIDLVKDVCEAILSMCGSHYDGEDEVYDDRLEVDAILKCNKEIRIALRNLPSAQPEQRWIPVTERLPENRRYVLVTYKYVYGLIDHGITWYGEAEKKWNTSRDVIAWMPLPEPYKGEVK